MLYPTLIVRSSSITVLLPGKGTIAQSEIYYMEGQSVLQQKLTASLSLITLPEYLNASIYTCRTGAGG
jgi:hypothetical protein